MVMIIINKTFYFIFEKKTIVFTDKILESVNNLIKIYSYDYN
jgi:hypothetical protein